MYARTIAWALLCLLLPLSPVYAQILVVAPHPDDDVLTAAGVILHALQAGEPVTVVYITNGENRKTPDGRLRQTEAVAGQRRLGLAEEHLIFLGYPDAYLTQILTRCLHPDDGLVTALQQSTTYGNRGLGRMDYHTYRFGQPATYNRPNIIADLADILGAKLPAHIYVPAQFDTHPDHSATYQLLKLALIAAHARTPDYVPIVHKTIVHWTHRPWHHPMDASALFAEIPGLAATGLVWEKRESLNVPLAMQSPDLSVNPKYLAIAAHASQGGIRGYLKSYVHQDEFFWAENILGANQPPVAEAGQDLFLTQGQTAVLDGSKSQDPDNGPLGYEWIQVAGQPVPLSNVNGARPHFVAPTGLAADLTLVFKLVVRDPQFASAPDFTTVRIKAGPLTADSKIPIGLPPH
jgi:LmbE family N-acetylglucosaminyl deacetylase